MTVTTTALGDRKRLEEEWRNLEARSDGSFFLSSAWIGCWLAELPEGDEPQLMRAEHDGNLAALGVLVPCRRTAGLPVRRLWLHETGDAPYDTLTVEYNGLLVDREGGDRVLRQCLAHLLEIMGMTTELRLSRIPQKVVDALRHAAATHGRGVLVSEPDPTFGIDLDALRRSGTDYMSSLRTSTRSALRRAVRLYEAQGPLRIHHAESEEEALAYFDALVRLHEARWQARDRPGAFAARRVTAFHRRLIARGIGPGDVRLSRISAGDEEIGYLYNFVWRGRVLNYQGGFRYAADNRLKPGLVSHYLAASDALARGESLYDFMAGYAPYKAQLGTQREPLYQVRVLSSKAAVWLFEQARAVRSLLVRRPAAVAVSC